MVALDKARGDIDVLGATFSSRVAWATSVLGLATPVLGADVGHVGATNVAAILASSVWWWLPARLPAEYVRLCHSTLRSAVVHGKLHPRLLVDNGRPLHVNLHRTMIVETKKC